MSAITDRRTQCAVRAVALAFIAAFGSCGGGSTPVAVGEPPPPPPPENTVLERGATPPAVELTILGVSGASGSDGTFQVGDHLRVHFSVRKSDGSPWGLSEMVASSVLVSGPTFNYQRIIAERTDVVARSTERADGTFDYLLADPIPASYLPPYNDTPSFGALDGELAGQPLLAGTYTVGLSLTWDYTVANTTFHSVGESTADFLFGGETLLSHREVTKQSNCERCHTRLSAHQGRRTTVSLCVLCHTSGAEDANDPNLAGGTPNTSIDSRVMVHRIHEGRHLPSVLGIGVDANGALIYNATPKPLLFADPVQGVHDYSKNGQTVFPNRVIPMPKDLGYKNLNANQQALEDDVRTGLCTCDVCHGDPDGPGPLTAPAQGTLVYAQPSMKACGACHDDVKFDQIYFVNGQQMPVQTDNSLCVQCHAVDGQGFYSPLAVKDAHLHPLKDPAYTGTTFLDFNPFPGLHLDLLGVAEGPGSNANGVIEPGEKLTVTLAITDDSGASFPLNRLDGAQAVLSGPSWNSNLVLETALATAKLAGSSPYTFELPERDELEFVGRSTGSLGDVFQTSKAPHWAVANAATQVRVRTATGGGSSTLSAAARAPQNFVDVVDATGFSRNDFVVLDDGVNGKEEYAQIQFVDGTRLWFGSPASPSYKASTLVDHAGGATIKEVTLATKTANVDYSLNASTGAITELQEFGANAAVVVSYTTDFVVPTRYGVPENDSPALDESSGEWRGKNLVHGTYKLAFEAYCDLDLNQQGEDNFYRFAATASSKDFVIGANQTLAPYALISSGDNCLACHQDLVYHGGSWRGFEACITCHAAAGSEDRPQYVSAAAPQTPGVTVNFRTLLHQIHRGSQLVHAADFDVIGEGGAAYPNDFSVKNYSNYLFAALPDRTAQCTKCHGASNTSWFDLASRDHPTQQSVSVHVWGTSCGTCHDSDAAELHIAQNSVGGESCAICHASGRPYDVATEHADR